MHAAKKAILKVFLILLPIFLLVACTPTSWTNYWSQNNSDNKSYKRLNSLQGVGYVTVTGYSAFRFGVAEGVVQINIPIEGVAIPNDVQRIFWETDPQHMNGYIYEGRDGTATLLLRATRLAMRMAAVQELKMTTDTGESITLPMLTTAYDIDHGRYISLINDVKPSKCAAEQATWLTKNELAVIAYDTRKGNLDENQAVQQRDKIIGFLRADTSADSCSRE